MYPTILLWNTYLLEDRINTLHPNPSNKLQQTSLGTKASRNAGYSISIPGWHNKALHSWSWDQPFLECMLLRILFHYATQVKSSHLFSFCTFQIYCGIFLGRVLSKLNQLMWPCFCTKLNELTCLNCSMVILSSVCLYIHLCHL